MDDQPTFWNVQTSLPSCERDRLRFVTFSSRALAGGRCDMQLFVPLGCRKGMDRPLVILLHGVYGSSTNWAFNGRAHLTAAEMIDAGEIQPMVLAMPSDGLIGPGTGYIPLERADCERLIVDAVIDCATEVAPCVSSDSPRFITGLSMGGYGALRLGAKYADRFRGISGHSSITHYRDLMNRVENMPAPAANVTDDDLDPVHWMIANKDRLPPLRFDCGTDDVLIDANRQLHQRLDDANIKHEYAEFDGGHTWAYWTEHLRDTLRFFDRLLGESQ